MSNERIIYSAEQVRKVCSTNELSLTTSAIMKAAKAGRSAYRTNDWNVSLVDSLKELGYSCSYDEGELVVTWND